MSQTGTLLHVEFYLNFHFLLSCASDVSLESFHLVTTPLVLVLQVLHFALQIYHEVSVGFKSTTEAVIGEFRARLWQAIAGLLLKDQVIDDLVLALQLTFNDLQFGSQSRILVLKIICSHTLFHDIVIETLSLLVDDARPELVHFEVQLAIRLGC